MSLLTRAGIGVILVCCTYLAVSAQISASPNLREIVSSVNARSAIVMNADTHEVLWSQDAERTHPIASLTKLMTAVLVDDSGIPLDTTVSILHSDISRASTTYLRLHDRVTVETLLYLMSVGSDNAAARALARTVTAPRKFLTSMNSAAQELNLTQTVYADPAGLSASNQSSAHDLASLIVHATDRSRVLLTTLLSTPIFQTRIGKRSVVVSNTNRFMDRKTLATKTGYTSAAKYCLTMIVEGAHGERYVIVVLGAPTSKERFAIGEMFQHLLSPNDTILSDIPVADDPSAYASTETCGPMPNTISEEGKFFIRTQETLRQTAYYDKVGYAIGYGMHTWQGQRVSRSHPGRVTADEVEDEFHQQLNTFVRIVKTHVCAPMTQPMLDSLVSVAWNLGRVNTSIVRKFDQNRPIVPRDFLTTATVRRRPLLALSTRRLREYLIFTGDYDAAMQGNTLGGLRRLTNGTQVIMHSAL